ncbi:MAG: Crp/Fnr family transcriptional regulator [Alphaproteobacteria bacterium]
MSEPAWIDRFPALADLAPAHRTALLQGARGRKLPAGAVAFSPDHTPDDYLLITDGRVRVRQISDHGREIVLYRIGGGESCILTTACLLAHAHYMAEGIAETEVRVVAVPRAIFDRLMAESPPFREFVLSTYATRMMELMLLVEELAFTTISHRLAQRMLELAGEADEIAATHQDLAVELGTAREVISRQLKEFERRGWVAGERGRVRLLDRPALQALAVAGRSVT